MITFSLPYSLAPAWSSLILCNTAAPSPVNCLARLVGKEELHNWTNRQDNVQQEEHDKEACCDMKEEDAKQIAKRQELNTTAPYYYYSVSDESSNISKNYCYFYDDATTVSIIVSLPNTLKKGSANKRSKGQRRFNELYERGKEKKRSELKRFLQQKKSQDSSSLRKYSTSVPRRLVSLPRNTFQEGSTKKRSKGQRRFDELYEQGKQKKRSELKRFRQQKLDQDSSFLQKGSTSDTSSVVYDSSFQESTSSSTMSTKRDKGMKTKQSKVVAKMSGKREKDLFVRLRNIENRINDTRHRSKTHDLW